MRFFQKKNPSLKEKKKQIKVTKSFFFFSIFVSFVLHSGVFVVVMSTNELRNMIRQSDIEGLEECILDGHGSKLLGENAADNKIRAFIKAVPSYLVNILF